MKKRNIIITIIIVIVVVISSIALWYNISNKSKLTNEVEENIVGLKTDLDNQVDMMRINIVLLKAKLAIQIEKSQYNAEQELDKALMYISDAKSKVGKSSNKILNELKQLVIKAKESVIKGSSEAKDDIDASIFKTESMIKNTKSEINVEATLLKARLAAVSENTYDSAYKYLEEAKRWYKHNNYRALKTMDSTSQEMIKKINEAQKYLKEKKDEAGVLISDILLKASELVKDDDQ
ncbi:MAG: hypothetical protein IMY69_08025 [Bacteroidetes bacterium]|nr:hypothetical protein [Bacteroidota bacterium]